MADLMYAIRHHRDQAEDEAALAALAQLTNRQLELIHKVTGALPPSLRNQIAEYRLSAGTGFIAGRLFDIDPGVMTAAERRTWGFAVTLAARFGQRFMPTALACWSKWKKNESKGAASQLSTAKALAATGNSSLLEKISSAAGTVFGFLKKAVTTMIDINPVAQGLIGVYDNVFIQKTPSIVVGQQFNYTIAVELGIDPLEADALVGKAVEAMGAPHSWKSWLQRWFFSTRMEGMLFWYHFAEAAQGIPAKLAFTPGAAETVYAPLYATPGNLAAYPTLQRLVEVGGDAMGPDPNELYGADIGGPIFEDVGMMNDLASLEAGGPCYGGHPDSEVGGLFGSLLRKHRGGLGQALSLVKAAGPILNLVPGGGVLTTAAGIAEGAMGAAGLSDAGKPPRPGVAPAQLKQLLSQVQHTFPGGGDDMYDDDEGGDDYDDID